MATSLHSAALAVKPNQIVKPSTYWVAVLNSDLKPAKTHKEEDFLWIKCHGGITVSVICAQYSGKHPQEGRVSLVHDSKIASDDTPIRQLAENDDRLVTFEAVKALDLPSRVVGERLPMTPKRAQQVSVRPGLNDSAVKAKSGEVLHADSPKPKSPWSKPPPQDENTIFDPSHRSPYIPPPRPSTALAPAAPSRLQVPGPPSGNLTGNKSISPIIYDPSSKPKPVAPPHAPLTLNTSELPDWATSNGFLRYAEESRPKWQDRHPGLIDAQLQQVIHQQGWLRLPPMERARYEDAARSLTGTQDVKFEPIKAELELHDILPVSQINEFPSTPEAQSFQLHAILKDASPEQLECSVEKGVNLLDQLKAQMRDKVADTVDAGQWIEQIDNLRKQAVKTKTIIGVVGNTGAGKSSVINALLDEERIIPTNCMRACTAVVTEISYNDTKTPYHAQIEFIKEADWERELNTLFQDLFDPSGNVSRDCANPDTEAGIAYAKIKAVYPKKTKEDMANSSIEKMLREVDHILGTNREIKETDSSKFYRRLQHFVDSKEKSTGDKKKERKEMEFWPLIRVVRIHVKSPALSTGAVIVDLPGVHDSNAARAAVAENYMKQCTGLWIVAPINRAVDDKAAKNLLGESFKRQLKMDGGFSTVTFICSKTDDISIMEAQESLGLDDEMTESWLQMEDLGKKQKALESELNELKDTRELLGATFNQADDDIEVWDGLRDSLEEGKTVFAPTSKPSGKKRKGRGAKKPRKKQRRDANSDDDFLDDENSDEITSEPDSEEDLESAEPREPLTEDQVNAKISELRSMKKEARRQRLEITNKMKVVEEEIEKARDAEEKIETNMAALCISGRNGYSKGAIQNDFAQGIRELDMEIAAEEDEENFNPDSDARDYDEVARSLPVFCVSSRGYQKLQGRLRKDPKVPGFVTAEETEIPQLQAHCKQLTEAGRSANCKRFVNNLSQLLNSLSLWASNDGTGANMTPEQRTREERFLQKGLKELESGLEKAVAETCKELSEEFKNNIFDNYDPAIANAARMAISTAQQWGAKVNREDRAAGGYCWSTYKAICRRNGEYSNAQGPHQWNNLLVEPMMKMLTSGWEKTFTRRLPMVMSSFIRRAANFLREFHHDVDGRARKVGAGIAGLHMLQQQLGVYETILKDLTGTVKNTVNSGQKEINREFAPVIARAMIAAYEACASESGPGSYMRMKAAMNAHVDQERHVMFQESGDEVRKRLQNLVRSVEESMSNRVDEVFLAMRRDYRSVLGGGEDPQGQVLPKTQRIMRKEVIRTIEGVENIFKKVMDGETDEMDSEEGKIESAKVEEATDEEKSSMSGDQEPDMNGTPGPESNLEDQDASRDVVSRLDKPSESLAAAGSKTDSEEREPSDGDSGPSANDSGKGPGKGVDSQKLNKESSEEEYEDPDADSSVKHSSSSESSHGESDSDDD